MNEKIYAARLEKKLVDQFIETFYEKLGYKPVVITQTTGLTTDDQLPLMSLETLKEQFTPFLPTVHGKKKDLSCKIRIRELVELRNIFCYIAKKMGYSLKNIGMSIGDRDHTTVIHNIRCFNNLMETNEVYREKYMNILKQIKKQYDEPPTLDDTDQVQCEPEPAVLS